MTKTPTNRTLSSLPHFIPENKHQPFFYPMKKTGLLLLTLVSCICFSLSAATLTVCASGCDHTTIQAAINAASPGDVIDIQDAVHTEDGIVVNKNLTIQGQGQSTTIVQAAATRAAADDRVFWVNSGLTVLFQDFTIQHGNVFNVLGGGFTKAGGGVYINNYSVAADISFERMRITNNLAIEGGGVFIVGYGAKVHFTDCVISDNEAKSKSLFTPSLGGGIYNRGAHDFKVIRCTISGNSAETFGGGAFINNPYSVNQWINCTIFNNTSFNGGGGLYLAFASLHEFINCTIVENKLTTSSTRVGGGIFWDEDGDLTLTNTIVANNTGGIQCLKWG